VLAMVKDKRSNCNSDYVLGSDRAQRLEEQKENEWVPLFRQYQGYDISCDGAPARLRLGAGFLKRPAVPR
jgi:hypothetical protein